MYNFRLLLGSSSGGSPSGKIFNSLEFAPNEWRIEEQEHDFSGLRKLGSKLGKVS